jgi:hypothetical protein
VFAQNLLDEKQQALQAVTDERVAALMASAPRASKINVTYGSTEPAAPVVATATDWGDKEQARATFTQLLEDKKITSTEDWTSAMQKLIFDPRYKALKRLSDKRAAFEEFRNTAKDRELKDEETARTEAKVRVMTLLGECEKITSRTRVREVEGLLAKEVVEEWMALRRRDQEDYFEECVRGLMEKEREQERLARAAYSEMLKGMESITGESRWKEVEALIETTPEYIACPRNNRQQDFSTLVRDLRAEAEAKRRAAREAVATGFRELLCELLLADEVDFKDRWEDVSKAMEKKADARYMAAADQARTLWNNDHKVRLEKEAAAAAKRAERIARRKSKEDSGSDSDDSDAIEEAEEREKERLADKAEDNEADLRRSMQNAMRRTFEDQMDKLDSAVGKGTDSLKALLVKGEQEV